MSTEELTLPSDRSVSSKIAEDNFVEVKPMAGSTVLSVGDRKIPTGITFANADSDLVSFGYITANGWFQPFDMDSENPAVSGAAVSVAAATLNHRPCVFQNIPTDRSDFLKLTALSSSVKISWIGQQPEGVWPLGKHSIINWSCAYRYTGGDWLDLPTLAVIELPRGESIELYSNIDNIAISSGLDGLSYNYEDTHYASGGTLHISGDVEASGSLSSMFGFATTVTKSHTPAILRNNRGLTKSPRIPSITLVDENGQNIGVIPYKNLLTNCENLQEITVEFTEWPDCTDWVKGVPAEGIFRKPEQLEAIYDDSHIPAGWTVVDVSQDEEL